MALKKPHHHGNLREALILAGIELLEEGGMEALTLRKCAARAGVSHAAPAHHFAGLISLEAAIVARGYSLFTRTMVAAREAAKQDPHSRLAAICEGYLTFANTNRALFNLIFLPRTDIEPGIDQTTLAELNIASTAAYNVLHDACAPFQHGKGGELATETMIWSLVHGYATLFAARNEVQKSTSHPQAEEVPDFAKILPELKLNGEVR